MRKYLIALLMGVISLSSVPYFYGGFTTDNLTATSTMKIPNSALPPPADCDNDTERGRIYIDTNAASGQQFYACEGISGWVLQGVGGAGTPGGLPTQFQYNAGGTFGGAEILTLPTTSQVSFNNISSTTFSSVSSLTFGNDVDVISSSATKFMLPNSQAPPTTDCDDESERGRIYIDTDAATGQQVYVCEGGSGWVAQGGGGTPGGSSGDIQYNNAGSFGGFGNFDSTTSSVTLEGTLQIQRGPGFFTHMSATSFGGNNAVLQRYSDSFGQQIGIWGMDSSGPGSPISMRRGMVVQGVSSQGTSDSDEILRIESDQTKRLITRGQGLTLLTTGQLVFYDADSSNYVGFVSSQAVPGNALYVLPQSTGSANEVLTTDGNNNLFWGTGGGGSFINNQTNLQAGSAFHVARGSITSSLDDHPILTLYGPTGCSQGETSTANSLDIYHSPTSGSCGNFPSANIGFWLENGNPENIEFGRIEVVPIDTSPGAEIGLINLLVAEDNSGGALNVALQASFSGGSPLIYSPGDYVTDSYLRGRSGVTLGASDTIAFGHDSLNKEIKVSTHMALWTRNELRFRDSDSSNFVGFRSSSTVTTNNLYVLPASSGTSGQAIVTDGNNNLSFATISGGSGSTIYNATSTAGFPFSFSASSAIFTQGNIVIGKGSIGTSIGLSMATHTINNIGAGKSSFDSYGNLLIGDSVTSIGSNNWMIRMRNTGTGYVTLELDRTSNNFSISPNATGDKYFVMDSGGGVSIGTNTSPGGGNTALLIWGGVSISTINTAQPSPPAGMIIDGQSVFKSTIAFSNSASNPLVTMTHNSSKYGMNISSNVFINGHIESTGTVPSISGCGTSPSIVGTDTMGTITIGTGGVATSCTVTFGRPWSQAPACSSSHEGAVLYTREVTTTTSLVIDAATALTASGTLRYFCLGRQ